MLKFALMGALLALAGAAHSQTTIFTTFNEGAPETLFDCCNTLPIHTRHTDARVRSAVAIPFTPATDAKIIEVDLALSHLMGAGRVKVQIQGSAQGLPGKVKHKFLAEDVPDAGQCCQFVPLTAGGITVKAGGHYWVVVEAAGHFDGGWNLNTADLSGSYATAAAEVDGWSLTEGPLPAVRIIAK
jgi:hypothetical protein